MEPTPPQIFFIFSGLFFLKNFFLFLSGWFILCFKALFCFGGIFYRLLYLC